MPEIYYCVRCREPLSEGSPPPHDQRTPCSRCGSMNVVVGAMLSDGLSLGEHASMLAERLGNIFSFGESKRFDGRSASADAKEDGSFDYAMYGSAPQNEECTLSVCRLLIDHLNEGGDDWGAPEYVDPNEMPGVDCLSFDISDSRKRLSVQVVRAAIDPSIWKTWNADHHFEKSGATDEELAGCMMAAIRKSNYTGS